LGERRWPMALAVLVAGGLRGTLPQQLRDGDARWLFFVVLVVLLGTIMIGDPGRIDRQSRSLRVMTGTLIAVVTLANASAAARLVDAIITDASSPLIHDARILLASGGVVWLTNVIAFALWYWDIDRGGAASRARGSDIRPAFVFPEMAYPEYVDDGWYPTFVDYLFLSFATATAFSPTDVSAIKPWSKLMLMAEEAVSLVVALLVVARAVNILN
jgi:uncharacterized membrane protein